MKIFVQVIDKLPLLLLLQSAASDARLNTNELMIFFSPEKKFDCVPVFFTFVIKSSQPRSVLTAYPGKTKGGEVSLYR